MPRSQGGGIGGHCQPRGCGQLCGRGLAGVVMPPAKGGHACGIDIEAQRVERLAKLDSQRQPNVAEADDGDARIGKLRKIKMTHQKRSVLM